MEDIKEDPLREKVQPPCIKDCKLEDKEVEFSLYEEDDYPSLCNENIDLLEKENVRDKIFDIFCDELK